MATHFKQLDYTVDIEELAYDIDVWVEWKLWSITEIVTLRDKVDRLMLFSVGTPVVGTLRVSTQRLLADYEGFWFYYGC